MLSGKKIAVLMGGPGAEREVSLASGKAVLKALLGLGLDAVAVDVTTTHVDLPEGTDLAFNVIHGTFGEDGQLQEILDARGMPYSASRTPVPAPPAANSPFTNPARRRNS